MEYSQLRVNCAQSIIHILIIAVNVWDFDLGFLLDLQPTLLVFIAILVCIAATVLAQCILSFVACLSVAGIPGPWLDKFMSGRMLPHTARGDRHLEILRRHEIYGPLVGLGMGAVSISTVNGLEDQNHQTPKDNWYTTAAASAGNNNKSLTPFREHCFGGRLLKEAYYSRGLGMRMLDILVPDDVLRTFDLSIVDGVQGWCKHLADSAQEIDSQRIVPKNMAQWTKTLTYSITGNLLFGGNWSNLNDGELRKLSRTIMDIHKFEYLIGYIPFARYLHPFITNSLVKHATGRRKYTKFINKTIKHAAEAEKQNSGETRNLFLSSLLATDTGSYERLTETESYADIRSLLPAAAQPTAIAISATLFYLLHNAEALVEVTAEVRSMFKNVDEIDTRAAGRAVYLRACVDEALRLSPPIPGHLPRQVRHHQCAATIDDRNYFVGSTVGTSAYAIHRNREYFPDPLTYWPERWIVDEADGMRTTKAIKRARSAFVPFGTGLRRCPGMGVAYMEILTSLATLLFSFDMRLPQAEAEREPTGGGRPDHPHPGRRRRDEYQLWDYYFADADGPMIELKAVSTKKGDLKM